MLTKRWIECCHQMERYCQESRYATDPYKTLIRPCLTRKAWRRMEARPNAKFEKALPGRLTRMQKLAKTTTNHWYGLHQPCLHSPLSAADTSCRANVEKPPSHPPRLLNQTLMMPLLLAEPTERCPRNPHEPVMPK